VKLSDLRGKVVLLDFWASWCGPCKLAMPEVEKIHLEFAGKPVQVMGVNLGDDADSIAEVLTAKGVTFGQVMDRDGAVAGAFGASGIPHTVLIDQEGIIQLIHQGYSPTMAQSLSADIEKLLRGESLVDKHALTGDPTN
jgi:thiol-disulfide isomerase/thioredoxin